MGINTNINILVYLCTFIKDFHGFYYIFLMIIFTFIKPLKPLDNHRIFLKRIKFDTIKYTIIFF